MSMISDGINAKILAALAKIPDQIAESLNQALPDQLASALTDSLLAVNQRLEELETTTNNQGQDGASADKNQPHDVSPEDAPCSSDYRSSFVMFTYLKCPTTL